MIAEIVVLLSDPDPVATLVRDEWGNLPATGEHLDGAAIRRLTDRVWVARRPGIHVHDEEVDLRLPTEVRAARPTLVFPSIHRSGQNVPCLTVHPLGNPGPAAEIGGRPRRLVSTDPRRMASALRLLCEGAAPLGIAGTYEATHHGPYVGLPAFFIEIGYGELSRPPPSAVRLLAETIPRIEVDPSDRIALGVGGGHYAPRFTELTLRRTWAFGHLLSRHVLAELGRATALEGFARSAGAEGVVYVRSEDARLSALEGIGPRLREQDAPARSREEAPPTTGDARSASGT